MLGNPLIKTKNDLEVEVNELKILKANFDRQKYNMQDNVMKKLPLDIQNTQNTINHIKEDIQFVSEQKPLINEEGKEYYPVTINGKEYADKEMVGKYIVALAQSAMEKEKSIGQYKGFELSVLYDSFQQKNMACLKSPNNGKKYYCQLNMDENVSAASNIRRLDNLLNNTLGQLLIKAQENLTNFNSELEISKKSMNEPFPRNRELEENTERLKEIELELQSSGMKCKDIELDLYEQLNELFPQIISKESTYIQLDAGEAFDKLNVEWVSENEIAVSHTYEQNGDIMRDPEIVFSINTDDFTASAVSYENSSLGKYEIYDESEESQAMKDDCNIFASEWFDEVYTLDALDEQICRADIVIGCLPKTVKTTHLLNQGRLRKMKKGGLVVNVGRGSLIVQPDLIQLLEEGYLSGAVLDVTDPEPLPSDNLLWGMKNVLITPHVSGISFGHTPQVEERVAKICAHNLKAFLNHTEMMNVVDWESGYRKGEKYAGSINL